MFACGLGRVGPSRGRGRVGPSRGRTSQAALAVVRRRTEGRSLWLARWNRNWKAFHFVGGHRHKGETFREGMVRELGEELGLTEGVDCEVGEGPLAHLEYSSRSRSAGVETKYGVSLFQVDLRGPESFSSRAEVRWLSDEEVRRGRCDDGRPVSPTMGFLISKAGLL